MRVRSVVALLLVAAAAPALPSAASARGLSVSVPKSITQYRSFAVTWEGDTGPSSRIGGGFIVRSFFIRGKKACPANAQYTSASFAASAGSANVFHSGAFRGAEQTYFGRSGTVRLCGYVSAADDSSTYELLTTKVIKVKALPKQAKLKLKAAPLKDGTYNAAGADILGGSPGATLSVVIAGGKVTSVTATGIPNTACSPDFSTQIAVTPSVASATPQYTDNPVIGEAFSANFTAPTGDVMVNAGGKSSKEIRGALTEDSANGSCRGGFGFIARR